jgi:hypothetical protein
MVASIESLAAKERKNIKTLWERAKISLEETGSTF